MKENNQITVNDLGRIPPQSIDTEESILGCCLSYPDRIIDVMSIISPEMFYKDLHQRLFSEMVRLTKDSKIADMITIRDSMADIDLMWMVKLTDSVVTDKMLEQHSIRIKEKYLLREYLRTGHTLANMSYSEPLDDVIDFAEREIMAINQSAHTNDLIPIGEIIDGVVANIQRVIESENKLIGVPSGLTKLDRITSGWNNTDLIILAARPSMGKTAMALQFAKNASVFDKKVAIFSLEMSCDQLVQRYISGATGYTNTEIKLGKIDIEKVVSGVSKLSWLPIYIDDSAIMTIFEMKSKLQKLKYKHGLDLVIVDYLQLMKGDNGGNREQEISSISRGLKMIAKELSVPVIALSQLNRSVESRADKKPNLSDLRESGAIEQDADMVLMMYRPSVYGISQVDHGSGIENTTGIIMFDICKNRNGALGELMLHHNDSLTVITDEPIKKYF